MSRARLIWVPLLLTGVLILIFPAALPHTLFGTRYDVVLEDCRKRDRYLKYGGPYTECLVRWPDGSDRLEAPYGLSEGDSTKVVVFAGFARPDRPGALPMMGPVGGGLIVAAFVVRWWLNRRAGVPTEH